jgi:hypothetical protein
MPLPPLDHTSIEYPEINKNFYEEHPEISQLSEEDAKILRKKIEVNVSGYNLPRPGKKWEHFHFDDKLMKEIARQNYGEPTNIQKQAIPAALSGRDIIGIAKTGNFPNQFPTTNSLKFFLSIPQQFFPFSQQIHIKFSPPSWKYFFPQQFFLIFSQVPEKLQHLFCL